MFCHTERLRDHPARLKLVLSDSAAFSDLVLMAVKDEDYDMGFQIQKTLGSKANEAFVFGRNEPALQHYHDHVAKFVSQT